MRIVLRLPAPGSALHASIVGSAALHAALAALVILLPFFRQTKPPALDAMVVALAGSIPGPPASAPGPAPPAAPAPAPRPARAAPAPAAPPKGPSVLPSVPQKPAKDAKPKKKEAPPEESRPAVPAAASPAPSPAGPAGTGTGGAATATGVTSLDVGESGGGWYAEAVRAALQSRWVKPPLEDETHTYSVVVRFEIARDGSARNVEVETPSGVPSLDRSALRAVDDASPFPPPPSLGSQPSLTARIRFDYLPGRP